MSEEDAPRAQTERGKTVHGEAANAGHRVLAPDDAEVEAYLETALNAPAPDRSRDDRPGTGDATDRETVVVLDFGSQFAQLIARRVRELDVYSELLPHDTPYAELERRGARAIILSGGPNSVYDDGRPAARPGDLERPDPGPRHLLRRPADGPRARRRRPPARPARVRPGQRHASPPTTALFAGLDREQPVWMSHGDSITAPARGLQRRPPRPTRRRSPAWPTPRRNLYGIQFHPEVVHTPRGRDVLRNFVRRHRRRRADLDGRPTSSTRPSPTSASGSTPMPATTGSDGLGHLRAVGRRRLGGRGGARPSRGRRPADLHLRRPRPDAQEGIGAAAGHLRARPRHEPGDGRRARALPRPAGRRRGPGAEAQDHRRRVHPGLRGGGRASSAGSTS